MSIKVIIMDDNNLNKCEVIQMKVKDTFESVSAMLKYSVTHSTPLYQEVIIRDNIIKYMSEYYNSNEFAEEMRKERERNENK